MATWNQNWVGVTYYNPAYFSQPLAGLLQGTKWGGPLGQGVQLTYSFASLSSWFVANYSDHQEYTAMTEFSAAEKAVVLGALSSWTTLCGLSAVQVEDNANTVGELRFARTDNGSAGEAAHAYYPSGHPTAGDIWMKNGSWHNGYYNEVVKGSYDYVALLHEIGHALGLKHSFEYPAMPNQYDSYLYTIMSYESKAGTNSNYASFYPTTPMYFDILAMQTLYGVDTATRAGNTIYTYTQGYRYFETIYDAGGIDTIVYNGSLNSTIDLNIGNFSSLSDAIYFGDNSSSRFTVCIGPNTIIERAAGGSGSDLVIGNAVANTLIGNAGNDLLYGNAGNDALYGGNGNDRMVGGAGSDVSSGGAGYDVFDFVGTLGAANVDTISDLNPLYDTIRLDNAYFTWLLTPGTLSTSEFWRGAGAHDGNDRIIYNAVTGDLIYDTNGDRSGGAIIFAHLPRGLDLTNTDFVVI